MQRKDATLILETLFPTVLLECIKADTPDQCKLQCGASHNKHHASTHYILTRLSILNYITSKIEPEVSYMSF